MQQQNPQHNHHWVWGWMGCAARRCAQERPPSIAFFACLPKHDGHFWEFKIACAPSQPRIALDLEHL